MIKNFFILLTGILAGILLIVQWRNYEEMRQIDVRGNVLDVSAEIALSVENNRLLREEVDKLQAQYQEYNSIYSANQQIEKDIELAELLNGKTSVKGEGISLSVDTNLTLAELTDILNEILQAGAEAVSINGTRLTNKTAGLESHGGQNIFAKKRIDLPLEILAIGDSKILYGVLNKGTSTLKRIEKKYPNIKIDLTEKEIKIPKLSEDF